MNTTTITLLALAALLTGCATPQPKIHPESVGAKVEACNGLLMLTLHGSSMTGLIDDGDVILVDTRYPYEDLSAGDVVTFKSATSKYDGRTTHMLFDQRGRGGSWRTLGVHNGRIDAESMGREEYIGKVVKIYKR